MNDFCPLDFYRWFVLYSETTHWVFAFSYWRLDEPLTHIACVLNEVVWYGYYYAKLVGFFPSERPSPNADKRCTWSPLSARAYLLSVLTVPGGNAPGDERTPTEAISPHRLKRLGLAGGGLTPAGSSGRPPAQHRRWSTWSASGLPLNDCLLNYAVSTTGPLVSKWPLTRRRRAFTRAAAGDPAWLDTIRTLSSNLKRSETNSAFSVKRKCNCRQ